MQCRPSTIVACFEIGAGVKQQPNYVSVAATLGREMQGASIVGAVRLRVRSSGDAAFDVCCRRVLKKYRRISVFAGGRTWSSRATSMHKQRKKYRSKIPSVFGYSCNR